MSEMRNDRAGDTVSGWDDFTERLESYLTTMTDEQDHLIIESPDVTGEDASPYVQVCGLDGGLRMEISGNRVLRASSA